MTRSSDTKRLCTLGGILVGGGLTEIALGIYHRDLSAILFGVGTISVGGTVLNYGGRAGTEIDILKKHLEATAEERKILEREFHLMEQLDGHIEKIVIELTKSGLVAKREWWNPSHPGAYRLTPGPNDLSLYVAEFYVHAGREKRGHSLYVPKVMISIDVVRPIDCPENAPEEAIVYSEAYRLADKAVEKAAAYAEIGRAGRMLRE